VTVLETPDGLFDGSSRHLVVLAHQDDEVPYAGLLARMNHSGADSLHIAYVTNGDGLAHESDMDPDPYAALREEESRSALAALGIADNQATWFRHSELSLYAEFGAMSDDADGTRPLFGEFETIAHEVHTLMDTFEPSAVWTMAWQGGNPEHDLTHAAALRAHRAIAPSSGGERLFYELPAYELLVVAMRFRPWVRRTRHRIELTNDELATKRAMMEMYPTQTRVISELRRVATIAGRLGRLLGRGFTLDEFASIEEFAPVPSDRDYTRSTHIHERLDYPGDDWQGRRIVFGRTLARVARAWL
jgi:LmbE family N-acetylglucosaminyl deacetylase